MDKTIYDLGLHEMLSLPFGISIMRVPSGFIYDCWNYEVDSFKQGVFVPFNDEFENKIDKLTRRKVNICQKKT